MGNEIILLRNNDNRDDDDLSKIQEFFDFLTGDEIPKGISLKKGHAPKMSAKKAMTIIWYLQEHLSLFPDHIEMCSNCGVLYDSWSEGTHWPAKCKNFCGSCEYLVPDRLRKY